MNDTNDQNRHRKKHMIRTDLCLVKKFNLSFHLSTRKIPGLDNFTGECDQTFRKEMPVLRRPFQKITFYEATMVLRPKTENKVLEENCRPISLKNTDIKTFQ